MSKYSDQFRNAGLTETIQDEANNSKEAILEWEDWEDLVLKIRTWDRNEHNWAQAFAHERVEIKNLRTKESFIKSLMDEYELKKKNSKQ